MDKKFNYKKIFLNIFLIFGISSLVFYMLLRGEDFNYLKEVIRGVSYFYLGLGILVSFFFILGESLSIRELLKIFGYKMTLIKTLKYGFTGFFFSSITPSSTGGQPMQVYEMKKDNIEISHGSLALLIELVIYQFVNILYASFSYIYGQAHNLISNNWLNVFILLGIVINIVFMSFILISIFNPVVSKKLFKIISRLILKLPIKDEKKHSIVSGLEKQILEYNNCSKYVLQNKLILFKVFLYTIFQMGSLFSVSYIIYLALGFREKLFIEFIVIQSLIYIISTFIPIPGSIGVNEGNFLTLFRAIYREKVLKAGLILTRGVSFYGLLLISMISLFVYKIVDIKKEATN